MQFEQFIVPAIQQKAIELSMKFDEEIVAEHAIVTSQDGEVLCYDATVITDKQGNTSWVDNNVPLVFVSGE